MANEGRMPDIRLDVKLRLTTIFLDKTSQILKIKERKIKIRISDKSLNKNFVFLPVESFVEIYFPFSEIPVG